MEDLVIRQKLVTDEKLLRRVAKRVLGLSKTSSSSVTESSQVELALKTELELLELNLCKQEKALLVHEQEERHYTERQCQLELNVGELEKEIYNLKSILELERQLRKNKDEYDVVAREILKFPSQSELLRSLEKVNAETSGLATSQNEIQRFIELEALAGYETIQQIKTIKRRVDLDLKSIQ